MGRRGTNGTLAREQPAAPLGSVPNKLGESWLPIGRKARVGAADLASWDAVCPLVPEEFESVPVLPGRPGRIQGRPPLRIGGSEEDPGAAVAHRLHALDLDVPARCPPGPAGTPPR